MRKVKLPRKRSKKRLSGGQQRKSRGKQSPRLSLQDPPDVTLLGGSASLDLTSLAGRQSLTNRYDPLKVKTQNVPQHPDIAPTVVRSELLYYVDHPASPLMSGEGPLRAVQSSPIDIYSMRMLPDGQSSYAWQGQFNEWPSLQPPPAQLHQDRRLPPLTAAAWDLSGKADTMARQAMETFDAAKVLKKVSDEAFEMAMKNEYFDGRLSDQVPMSSMGRESQENMFANRSMYPGPVRMEVPQQQSLLQQQQRLQQSIPESRPVAKSILKNTASSNKLLPSRNLGSERSVESSFLEDDHSFSKPPPSLALGAKVKTKQAEAETGVEASKLGGRPRTHFANLTTDTTPKKTGVRRRGSVFVGRSLLPDENDKDELSALKMASDESFTMRAGAPSGADSSDNIDAVQRLKLSISRLPNVESKKQETDSDLWKRQDLMSPLIKNTGGAQVTVRKWSGVSETDTKHAPGFTGKDHQRPLYFDTQKDNLSDGQTKRADGFAGKDHQRSLYFDAQKDNLSEGQTRHAHGFTGKNHQRPPYLDAQKNNLSDAKNKLESATIADVWRKQDVVTVCDRSTCISVDRATETPNQWEGPSMCSQALEPCGFISTLSLFSTCSKCASEASKEYDTFLTPTSMKTVTSASQTSLSGLRDGHNYPSSALMSDTDNKTASSRTRRTSKERSDKHKRKHSGDHRRSSWTPGKESDGYPKRSLIRTVDGKAVFQNGDDFHKDAIVTTKLSDTLLDIVPALRPIFMDVEETNVKGRRTSTFRENVNSVTSRRASVHKNTTDYSKYTPASSKNRERRGSENTSSMPTATKNRRESTGKAEVKAEPQMSSRRPSTDSEPRKNSVRAKGEPEYIVLAVEPIPPLELNEATHAPHHIADCKQAANENPDADVLMDDVNVKNGEQHGLQPEIRKVSAIDYGPINSTVRKASIKHNQPTGDDAKDSFYNESLPAYVDNDEIVIDEGALSPGSLQNSDGNLGPEEEDVEKGALEVSSVERLQHKETLPAQDARPELLDIPEPQAQLAAVVTIPFEGDRKFWFYKDSTVSLYPEIRQLRHLVQHRRPLFQHGPIPFPPTQPPEIPDTSEPPPITWYPTYPPIITETGTWPQMDTYYCATMYCDKEARYLSSFGLGDPCENFYEDVCVNRTRLWPQPPPGASTSTSSRMAEQIQASVLWYMNDDRNSDVQIARNLLTMCMLESEQDRVATVKSVVGEVLGVSWPIDRSSEASLPDPWEVAGRLACELGLEPLSALSIDVHPEKAGVMIVGIDEPILFQRRSSTGMQLSELIFTSVREAVSLVRAGPEIEEISNLTMETLLTISDITSAPSVRYFGSENYRLTPLGDMQSGVKSMLEAIFYRYRVLDDSSEILVKSPSYFERLLSPNVMPRPRGLLNYMGYRVFLLFAAFTSSTALQEVHSILAHRFLGFRDANRLNLCAREVEHVLPAMYARAFFRQMRNTSFDTLARAWSSKVEQVFQRGLARLSWFRERGYNFHNSVDLLLAKHKLSTSLIRYFYPNWVMNNASYAAYAYQLQERLDKVRGFPDSGVKVMRALYGLRFDEKIEPFVGHASGLAFPASSLDASPRYDVETKSLFVPVAVMNASVPTNGSMFAFHIARYGVRLIKGLMPVLYNDFVFSSGPYDNAPLLYTQGYDRRLRDTIKCLVGDYYRAPDILKSNFMRSMGDISPAGFSLLEQTVALMVAYWAFQELLTVKRVWQSDFRFAQLPDLTSEQLFFVYYALDNCERGDDAYYARAFDARFELPPEERVNFPLLQMDAFKRAFGCRGRSPMATAPLCSVAI
ncbi:hypothetical protein MRX96_037672 [Rhipicephalus microplus]